MPGSFLPYFCGGASLGMRIAHHSNHHINILLIIMCYCTMKGSNHLATCLTSLQWSGSIGPQALLCTLKRWAWRSSCIVIWYVCVQKLVGGTYHTFCHSSFLLIPILYVTIAMEMTSFLLVCLLYLASSCLLVSLATC